MMVTEQEAIETKWCPHVRVRADGGVKDLPANRVRTGKEGLNVIDTAALRCIGTACMSWRTVEDRPETKGGPLGYCGLAGIPCELLVKTDQEPPGKDEKKNTK